MTWMKGLAAAGLAAVLAAGCSERKAEDQGDRAAANAPGERTPPTAGQPGTETGSGTAGQPGTQTDSATAGGPGTATGSAAAEPGAAPGSAPANMERGAERTERALENAGDRTAEAGREAAAGVKEAGQEIAGTVESITEDTLDLGDREIKIGEDTEFYRDGTRIERNELRPGDEVRAAFDEAGDDLKAKRIEVQSKAK